MDRHGPVYQGRTHTTVRRRPVRHCGSHRTGWPGFYTWAQENYPSKPIIVAEWGVFSDERVAWRKAWVYRSVAEQIDRYPAIKGLVYFDSPQAPRGDTRIDSDADALQAYRELGASPELIAPSCRRS